jgi:hypothetical protein
MLEMISIIFVEKMKYSEINSVFSKWAIKKADCHEV